MKNLNKLVEGVAKICISIGEKGAVKYSIPLYLYEPKVPKALLKNKK